jgi:hypothetical protein
VEVQLLGFGSDDTSGVGAACARIKEVSLSGPNANRNRWYGGRGADEDWRANDPDTVLLVAKEALAHG